MNKKKWGQPNEMVKALDQYHKKRALAETVICCLCEKGFNDPYGGHNPDPLGKEGDRCCDDCNATKVIPARLANIS
jgi:hypothetical protein